MWLRPGPRAPRARSGATRPLAVATALGLAWGGASPSFAQGGPITFSVIGDIPYSENLADRFRTFVADHNARSPSELFVHVGDIQAQSSLCPESDTLRAADIMRALAVPTFVLPGDNEWNDCADPAAAWILWEAHFLGFEQNFCGTPELEAQAVRPENFAFVRERVLFLGLNLVGGTVHDPAEWELRMQQNADWVEQQLAATAGQARAAVVFGQAGRGGGRDPFFERFDVAAAAFSRPMLYIHGDGHSWIHDPVWGVPNLSRIQIEQGDPPLQVTVTLDPQNPFLFTRDPWPAGTPVRNQPPCVDAGPDQVVALGQSAELQGFTTDDGDPTASVALEWSQASGPNQAQAVLSDPTSSATTAAFPEAGTYVLRLTADDGELAASDEVAIFIDAGQPYLSIADASVVEGDAGAAAAAFRVELAAASGAPVSVEYATLDETAASGSDYLASSGTLVFSGTSLSQTIDVPVVGDRDLEDFETFRVVLSDPSGAVIADGAATGLIRDDDIPRAPVVTSFLPARGPPGTRVTLAGEFLGVVAVSVGGAPAPFTVLSESALELVVPPDARSGPISVANVGGTGQSLSAFGVEVPLVVAVTGAGSVSVDPPGALQIEGATVQLTPLPAPGWEFLAWGGAAEGNAVPAVIEMAGETLVTALFVEQGSVVRIPWSAPVPSASDDAEENLVSGSVELASGDLELGYETGTAKAVGLRFPGIAIPQGTPIVSASVQFTVDEASLGPAELLLRAEAADDAAPFSSTRGDLTARPTTSASVAWRPPDWTAAREAGAAQRTPDLAELIQEVVDRPGWASGNALVLTLTGTGTRIAESQDGNPDAAPRLEILAVVDVAPPETPANLRSPDRTETSIDLAWDAAYDNLGVALYRLYTASGAIDLAGTSWTATGLAPDTEYAFQVSALDAAGNESPPSPPLGVRTRAPDREPPSSPRNLRSPAQTETTIELAWDASTDDRGVVAYRVYHPEGSVDVAQTTFGATGLSPGALYAFQVTALDAAGNESLPSALLRVRTRAPDTTPPSTPSNLRSPAQTMTRIDLAWDAATDGVGVTGYRLYRASGPIDLAGTTFGETGLVPGREYGFQVSALDAAGNESAPSPVLRVRTDRPPTTPANLRSPAQSETTIDLAWDVSTDDRDAVTYRLLGPSGAVDLAGTTWRETGLLPDREYEFQVSALDAAGNESARSPVLRVRTDRPPTTPANLRSPAQSETTIDLAWDAATDDRGVVGYRLYGPGGAVDLAGTSWSATGLVPDTTYAFQVSALDTGGNESPPSPVLGVRTRAPDTAPPSTPPNLRSPAQTTTRIDLAWDAASDDRGVVGYRLYRTGGPVDVAGTTWSEAGLLPGREYGFQVSALDAAGNESAPSPVLRVRTDRPPTTPANLRSPSRTETTIDLAWDAATDDRGVAGYRLYGPSGAVEVAGTSYTATGLAPDTEYAFQVSALDTAGNESPPSPPLLVRTRAPDIEPPSTPANLRSPAQSETTIALAWDAATDDRGVAGYRVYGPSGAVDVAGTSYTETGLAPLTAYEFQVSALDAAGNESVRTPVLRVSTLGRVARASSLRVAASADDAEENAATGAVSLGSGDLELAVDGTISQLVGLRFRGVAVPQGAPIVSASVQFTADEVRTGPVALTLRGEAADDAAPFAGTAFHLSGRSLTSSSVAWSPPDWTAVGAAGAAQRTPDLSALVQEIVGRPGWAAGNDLVLLVSGTGTRTAESYDGAPGAAPLLEIVYLGDPDTQPPTVPANLRSPAQTLTSIDLAWDASSDDFGVVGYRVHGPSGAVAVAGTTWTATGLAPDTEYAFQVSALDAAGNESAPSPVLRVRTLAPDVEPPSTPQNLRSPAQTASRIELAWDPATDNEGVTGYRVYGPSGAVDVAGTSYAETGLAPLTSYAFQVSAFDAEGNESVRSPVLAVSTTDTETLIIRISAGGDDAEENRATGAVNLANGDLELGVDGTVAQAVGLRFPGVAVPQGAPIVSASVQFTADEVRTGPVALTIRGEAADDAAPFAGTAFQVSGRPATSSSVAWSPPDWTAVGAAGAAQTTPDLSALVQEIVDRPGWNAGNALVLVVSGSGTRTAESFNGLPAAAPALRVEYRVEGPAPP